MAPDPINTERVYRGLKAQILAGEYSLGARIDPQAVAYDYGTSVTPVRDAIHRLIGERLLELRPHGGFYAPPITNAVVTDLYEWNARLALFAAKLMPKADGRPLINITDRLPATASPGDIAEAGARLFAAIGDRTGSRAHRIAVELASDGLHAARLAEVHVMRDVPNEISELANLIDLNLAKAASDRIAAYHRRRVERISEIIGTVHSFHRRSSI